MPIAIAALLALVQPAAFARLDRTVYDTLLRWSPPVPPDPRLVIVDIDERSLATIGQWPWRRDHIARLITRLRDTYPTLKVLVLTGHGRMLDGEGFSWWTHERHLAKPCRMDDLRAAVTDLIGPPC